MQQIAMEPNEFAHQKRENFPQCNLNAKQQYEWTTDSFKIVMPDTSYYQIRRYRSDKGYGND